MSSNWLTLEEEAAAGKTWLLIMTLVMWIDGGLVFSFLFDLSLFGLSDQRAQEERRVFACMF